MGSIGPLHYGHIGGIYADSFLGSQNPNGYEAESDGSIGTPTGGSAYQENVGNPQENIVGMAPNEQQQVICLLRSEDRSIRNTIFSGKMPISMRELHSNSMRTMKWDYNLKFQKIREFFGLTDCLE